MIKALDFGREESNAVLMHSDGICTGYKFPGAFKGYKDCYSGLYSGPSEEARTKVSTDLRKLK